MVQDTFPRRIEGTDGRVQRRHEKMERLLVRIIRRETRAHKRRLSVIVPAMNIRATRNERFHDHVACHTRGQMQSGVPLVIQDEIHIHFQ